MGELEELRKENRVLRGLLANANDLLAKSKVLLAKKSPPRAAKKASKTRPKRRSRPV
jgi:hypothetical protein